MSEIEKIVQKVKIRVCDFCQAEIEKGKEKKFSTADVCPACYGTLPEAMLKHAGDIWQARCNGAAEFMKPSDLATGIWVLYEGDEDTGFLQRVETLEDAKKLIIEEVQEHEQGPRNLVDVFRDGKPLGTTVLIEVKFTNLPE